MLSTTLRYLLESIYDYALIIITNIYLCTLKKLPSNIHQTAADDDGALGVDDEFDIYEDLGLDSISLAAFEKNLIDGESHDAGDAVTPNESSIVLPTETTDLDCFSVSYDSGRQSMEYRKRLET